MKINRIESDKPLRPVFVIELTETEARTLQHFLHENIKAGPLDKEVADMNLKLHMALYG